LHKDLAVDALVVLSTAFFEAVKGVGIAIDLLAGRNKIL
jgi:hypothetical protein